LKISIQLIQLISSGNRLNRCSSLPGGRPRTVDMREILLPSTSLPVVALLMLPRLTTLVYSLLLLSDVGVSKVVAADEPSLWKAALPKGREATLNAAVVDTK